MANNHLTPEEKLLDLEAKIAAAKAKESKAWTQSARERWYSDRRELEGKHYEILMDLPEDHPLRALPAPKATETSPREAEARQEESRRDYFAPIKSIVKAVDTATESLESGVRNLPRRMFVKKVLSKGPGDITVEGSYKTDFEEAKGLFRVAESDRRKRHIAHLLYDIRICSKDPSDFDLGASIHRRLEEFRNLEKDEAPEKIEKTASSHIKLFELGTAALVTIAATGSITMYQLAKDHEPARPVQAVVAQKHTLTIPIRTPAPARIQTSEPLGPYLESRLAPPVIPERTEEKSAKATFSITRLGESEYLVKSSIDGELIIGGLESPYRVPVHAGKNAITVNGTLVGDGYVALRADGRTQASSRGAGQHFPNIVPQSMSRPDAEPLAAFSKEQRLTTDPFIYLPLARSELSIDDVCLAPDNVLAAKVARENGLVEVLGDLECALDGATKDSPMRPVYDDLRGYIQGEVDRLKEGAKCEPAPEPEPVTTIAAAAEYDLRRRGSGRFKSVDAIADEYGVKRVDLLREVDERGIERRSVRTTASERSQRRDYLMSGLSEGKSLRRLAEESGWSESTLRRDYKAVRS